MQKDNHSHTVSVFFQPLHHYLIIIYTHKNFKRQTRPCHLTISKNRSYRSKNTCWLVVFKRLCCEHSLATAATRYPQVKGWEAGCPLGSISWMKMQPIIRAENRCFQQRTLHHYGPVGNEGKYQGPGIYDVAFWKQSRSDAQVVSQTSGAIYRIKMEKQEKPHLD